MSNNNRGPNRPEEERFKTILVIGSQQTNYQALFEGSVVQANGVNYRIKCEHCTWDDLRLTSYGDQGGLVASISPSVDPIPGTRQDTKRSGVVDIVLLRAGCRGGPTVDTRSKLSVIAHSGVTTLNDVDSFFLSQDKARMNGKMVELKQKLGGFKNFPWIQDTCYSDWTAATFLPDFPCVVKVGTASGGLGKARVNDAEAWADMRSILGMQNDVFTTQSLVAWKYDIRVQKIGNHLRAFRRTGKNWKSNVDMTMKDEDIPVEDRWAVWIKEAALALKQDICAMDILQTESGAEFILECNSSAIGLNGRHMVEDMGYMRDLTLMRLKESLENKAAPLLEAPAAPVASVEAMQREIQDLKAELELKKSELARAQAESIKNTTAKAPKRSFFK